MAARARSLNEGPLRNETPSRMVQLDGSSHSGPAKPRMPVPGPKRSSKISPVSSKTMALRPSGAAGCSQSR